MPTNYSAVGGYGRNPYDPRRDPREATRTAAGPGHGRIELGDRHGGELLGRERRDARRRARSSARRTRTCWSGIKPTVGRISRYGIIPITADQDTAGPMARTVTDAAIMLGVLEGAAPDPDDPATTRLHAAAGRDYTKVPEADALKGARIGIPRAFFYNEVTRPRRAREPRGGLKTARPPSWPRRLPPQGRRARSSSIRRTSRAFSRPTRRRTPSPGARARELTAPREGRGLLGGVQVRHEARLQRLAGDAGRVGAGEDADRAAALEPRACARRRHQVRPVEPRHLGRDGRRPPTRPATRRIARRTSR